LIFDGRQLAFPGAMKMHSGSLHPKLRLDTIELKVMSGLLDPQLRMIPFKPREIKLGKLVGMAAPRTPLMTRLIASSWMRLWVAW
jgi:hypothetical protein